MANIAPMSMTTLDGNMTAFGAQRVDVTIFLRTETKITSVVFYLDGEVYSHMSWNDYDKACEYASARLKTLNEQYNKDDT